MIGLQFLIGTIVVLVATFLYSSQPPSSRPAKLWPPPIRIESYEKGKGDGHSGLSPPNDFSIKLPPTPLLSATTGGGLSTSRPTSPSHTRAGSNRNAAGSYFPRTPEE
jgi:UDP-sugar transporter A1/2/3